MEKYIAVDQIDSYYEQVVPKRINMADFTKLVLVIFGILGLIALFTVLTFTGQGWLLPLAFTALGLGIYLIVRILKNSRIEYEYTFVLGELRIARIKGKAKRRNITYFDVKSIDDIGRYIDPNTGKCTLKNKKIPLLLHAATDDFGLDTYYLIIHDKVRRQPAVLLMTPDVRTLSLIRPYLSVELKKKFFKMQQEDELIRAAMQKKPTETSPAPEKAAASHEEKIETPDTSADKEPEPTEDGKNAEESTGKTDEKKKQVPVGKSNGNAGKKNASKSNGNHSQPSAGKGGKPTGKKNGPSAPAPKDNNQPIAQKKPSNSGNPRQGGGKKKKK